MYKLTIQHIKKNWSEILALAISAFKQTNKQLYNIIICLIK